MKHYDVTKVDEFGVQKRTVKYGLTSEIRPEIFLIKKIWSSKTTSSQKRRRHKKMFFLNNSINNAVEIKSKLGLQVTPQTVRNILHTFGIHCREKHKTII